MSNFTERNRFFYMQKNGGLSCNYRTDKLHLGMINVGFCSDFQAETCAKKNINFKRLENLYFEILVV